MELNKCCICDEEAFWGMFIFKYSKKICSGCINGLAKFFNLKYDLEIPLNTLFPTNFIGGE